MSAKESRREEGSQQRAISLVVRIAAFQAVDPGSNPGWRITFCTYYPFSKNCTNLRDSKFDFARIKERTD